MARDIPRRLRSLTGAFITQYPILHQPPHTELSSGDLDRFGIAQGVYGTNPANLSSNDRNVMRNRLVGRLNTAGSAQPWANTTDGFQVVVVSVGAAGTSRWQVKPLPVAIAHGMAVLPAKMLTRIVNKHQKIEREYAAVDWNKVDKEEKKLLETDRNVMADIGQLQADMTRIQNATLTRAAARLQKARPGNRLL